MNSGYLQCDDVVLVMGTDGVKLSFGAMAAGEFVCAPVHVPARTGSLTMFLGDVVDGLRTMASGLKEGRGVSAISIAFPGPADYAAGIIWDVPNMPCFRGGVALGPMLEKMFSVPVFINNDGSLFALAEARAGALPYVNRLLSERGCRRRFSNLLGATVGQGFGGGVVTGGRLLEGDNGCAGDMWCFPGVHDRSSVMEAVASAPSLCRMYSELCAPEHVLDEAFDAWHVYGVAAGSRSGDVPAALSAFDAFGRAVGDALCYALNVVDGLVVVGGSMAGMSRFFMSALVDEMNSALLTRSRERVARTQMRVFNLEDFDQREAFLSVSPVQLRIPGACGFAECDPLRRSGVILGRLPAETAVPLGAYIYAAEKLG